MKQIVAIMAALLILPAVLAHPMWWQIDAEQELAEEKKLPFMVPFQNVVHIHDGYTLDCNNVAVVCGEKLQFVAWYDVWGTGGSTITNMNWLKMPISATKSGYYSVEKDEYLAKKIKLINLAQAYPKELDLSPKNFIKFRSFSPKEQGEALTEIEKKLEGTN